MNKILLNTLSIALIFSYNCKGQDQSSCNRATYGTKKYIEVLPHYICIPNGYVIDDYVKSSDLNNDGITDFLAVKYNKKEDDQIDGDSTYWDFYRKLSGDTTFSYSQTLSNIVPPYIKELNFEYLLNNPTAGQLYETYPRRMKSNSLSFELNSDTLRLRYKLDDTFGKSFVFLFNKLKGNWYLELIEYFIGELPRYWWENDEFYYELKDAIKIIEKKTPMDEIPIDQLDLKESYKFSEDEYLHLSDHHMNSIQSGSYKSILKYHFEECDEFILPQDWKY